MTPADHETKFRSLFRSLQRFINQNQAISPDELNKLKEKMNALMMEFEGLLQSFKAQYLNIERERDQLKGQLRNAKQQILNTTQQMSNVVQDRSRISAERDSLLLQINNLDLKTKSSDEKLKEVEKKWSDVNAGLLDRLDVVTQQLTGKRALWMASNPLSSARRNAVAGLIQDPFSSPTPASYNITGRSVKNMGSMDSTPLHTNSPLQASYGSSMTPSGPPSQHPKSRRRLPNLPTGNAASSRSLMSVHSSFGMPTITTEPADPSETVHVPSVALVLHNPDNEGLAGRFRAIYNQLYYEIDLWVRKYTSMPNAQNDFAISSSNQQLWGYMMDCTYPGQRQDAHSHVVALLNDSGSRSWFVFRLIITYIVKDIAVHETFKSFSSDIEAALRDCAEGLSLRGMHYLM